MNYKEIVNQVLKDVSKIKTDVQGLKKQTESFIKSLLKIIKDRAGVLPSEKEFLKFVAELINVTIIDVYVPRPYKTIIKILKIPHRILKLLDKYVLDKFLGKSWYSKLVYLIYNTK
jgi:hypothetical protein